MLILGIETSGSVGSVALWQAGTLLGERCLSPAGRRHAQALTAEMALLFEEAGRTPADCQGVAVSIGPGSFTGLRIGVVCAKTFAYAVDCPITAVETFAALAARCPVELSEVRVIADAQRGDLSVGHYQRSPDGVWLRPDPIALYPAVEWCEGRTAGEIITGDHKTLSRWQSLLEPKCRLLPESLRTPEAGTICRLGERQFQAGQIADLWALEPLYLRPSSAEEQWELKKGQRGKGAKATKGEDQSQ